LHEALDHGVKGYAIDCFLVRLRHWLEGNGGGGQLQQAFDDVLRHGIGIADFFQAEAAADEFQSVEDALDVKDCKLLAGEETFQRL
jgi:hypothetical protein